MARFAAGAAALVALGWMISVGAASLGEGWRKLPQCRCRTCRRCRPEPCSDFAGD